VFLQNPDMSMRENLCRANLPPEAMRENPLPCKYIAGGHCVLAKRLGNQISCRCSDYGFTIVWQRWVVQVHRPPTSFIVNTSTMTMAMEDTEGITAADTTNIIITLMKCIRIIIRHNACFVHI
jgi:hypothetical protein